jgi:hypothetical protein
VEAIDQGSMSSGGRRAVAQQQAHLSHRILYFINSTEDSHAQNTQHAHAHAHSKPQANKSQECVSVSVCVCVCQQQAGRTDQCVERAYCFVISRGGCCCWKRRQDRFEGIAVGQWIGQGRITGTDRRILDLCTLRLNWTQQVQQIHTTSQRIHTSDLPHLQSSDRQRRP